MIRVRQIKINVREDSFEELKNKVVKKLGINSNELIDLKIYKKSIDARDKSNVLYNYEVNVSLTNEDYVLKRNKSNDILKSEEVIYKAPIIGNDKLDNRPIIVGSGPSGLFAALLLAENGYNPLIIERGERIEERVKTVNEFWETGKLKLNSNVSFGEGGAGTFSDGKLNTLISDKNGRIKKVFDTFIDCGADPEIGYLNKPHIGTDVLRTVIVNLRKRIEQLGGKFLFNTTFTNIIVDNNKIKYIEVNNNEQIPCDVLILAIGHSARDTIKMLYDNNIRMEGKPFAVGLRIQHKQMDINKSLYGDYYKDLPAASYKLTYKSSNGRGVYSFCMCPGGYVVNSSSEENHLIVNGMSNHDRDSENANSALVVTVGPSDFGNNPLDGLEYQRQLEKLAYQKGNGNIPVELLKDYMDNKTSSNFNRINPVFKGNYTFANLNEILPSYVNESLKEAIVDFDKHIKGFNDPDAILAGVESRTSSAVRIDRDENCVSNIQGIYPIGEGAGYSGGITSSAIDGIKTAEKIIERYSNN